MSLKRSLQNGGSCSSDTGVCSWKAIPYAEPMNKRFSPSKPLDSLEASLESSRYKSHRDLNDGYGPMCFQWFPGLSNKYDVDEDCLTLNIWAPFNEATTENENLKSVILWIHGGSYLEGGGATHWSAYGLPGNDTIKLYDGANLVRAASAETSTEQILVVSAQYRLGPFGFLVQPTDDKTETTGGANGLGDIITALRWLNKHISKFGGDPNQITLMGEGSGSVTACALLHSPVAEGLFHRAILQSGNCYPSIDYLLPEQDARNVRERFLERVYPHDGNSPEDDDSMYTDAQDFLLHAPAEELLNRTLNAYEGGSAATSWVPMYMDGLGSPSVDGKILPDLPIHLTPHRNLQVLVGVTSNDKVPAGLKRPSRSTEQFYAMLEIENLRKAYHDFGDEDDADLFLDACIRCESQNVLKRVADAGGSAFWYNYDCPKDAAPHGSTSMAVLGNIDPIAFESDVVNYLVGPPPSEELIHRMQLAWISFATTGNPGWVDATEGGKGALIFCQETRVEPLIDKFGRCDDWTEWAYAHGAQYTGNICMMESSIPTSPQTKTSGSFTGFEILSGNSSSIIPTSVILFLLLISRYIVIRRRLDYSQLQ